ncbi:hypothetical protein N9972_01260 [bacterium]|nr:hypothetical protein [bacterium]
MKSKADVASRFPEKAVRVHDPRPAKESEGARSEAEWRWLAAE